MFYNNCDYVSSHTKTMFDNFHSLKSYFCSKSNLICCLYHQINDYQLIPLTILHFVLLNFMAGKDLSLLRVDFPPCRDRKSFDLGQHLWTCDILSSSAHLSSCNRGCFSMKYIETIRLMEKNLLTLKIRAVI